jgi:hypothetical protein
VLYTSDEPVGANEAIYDYLKSKGAVHAMNDKEILAKPISLELFIKVFGSRPLEDQVNLQITYGVNLKAPLFYRFFNEIEGARTILKTKPFLDFLIKQWLHSMSTGNAVASQRFRLVYDLLFPHEYTFKYSVDPRIAFSQKGYTCGQDVLFTILFESKEFQPLLEYDWERFSSNSVKLTTVPKKPVVEYLKSAAFPNEYKNLYNDKYVGSSIDQYVSALKSAKLRYSRMPSVNKSMLNAYKGPLRRSKSVQNLEWETPYKMLNTSCKPTLTGGLRIADISIFLEKLLVENIFGLNGFGHTHYDVQLYEPTNLPPPNITNACAFILLIRPFEAKNGHFIGFYENDGYWYLVDNETGFIHKILDTEWFNTVFIPRMLRTMKDTKEEEKLDNGTEKVFLLPDERFKDAMLNYQFFTPGERSYPNLMPMGSFPPMIWIPHAVTVVTRLAGPTAAAGAATGSAAGGAAAGAASRPRRGGSRRTRRRGHPKRKVTRRRAH